MDRCPVCDTFFTACPCCYESFCPDCRMTESEAEEREDEENE
jgi:hypothetical protein